MARLNYISNREQDGATNGTINTQDRFIFSGGNITHFIFVNKLVLFTQEAKHPTSRN